jgi:hypothetical protein
MATPARPPLATAAAILLIVVGALNILGGVQLFGLDLGAIGAVFGVLALAIGAAGILAGVQVLGLKEQGRVTGLAVAGVGAVLNIYSITQGVTVQIVGLLLNAFIIFALVNTQSAFRRD